MAAWLLILLLGAAGVALAASVSAARGPAESSPLESSSGRHGFAWGATLLVLGALLASVAGYQSLGPREYGELGERASASRAGQSFILYEESPDEQAEPIVPVPSDAGAAGGQPAPEGKTVDGKAVKLPGWATQDVVRERSRTLATVSGRQFSTVEEAQADALVEAVKLFDAALRQDGRYHGAWQTPAEFVEQHAIHRSFVEPVTHSTPKNMFQVYRVYLQVNVSPSVIAKFENVWEKQQLLVRKRTVEKRLWTLGSGVAWAALFFTTIAGYLRLDERTQGAHRGRLKAAAVSLLAAGGLAAAVAVNYV